MSDSHIDVPQTDRPRSVTTRLIGDRSLVEHKICQGFYASQGQSSVDSSDESLETGVPETSEFGEFRDRRRRASTS